MSQDPSVPEVEHQMVKMPIATSEDYVIVALITRLGEGGETCCRLLGVGTLEHCMAIYNATTGVTLDYPAGVNVRVVPWAAYQELVQRMGLVKEDPAEVVRAHRERMLAQIPIERCFRA